MQMQQVRYFLALCEELNFTRAARCCGISQPSLTTAISALERELGGALFHRKPSIALTGLGRMVRPYLDEIARNADHAREVARTLTPRPVADRSGRQAVDNSERRFELMPTEWRLAAVFTGVVAAACAARRRARKQRIAPMTIEGMPISHL